MKIKDALSEVLLVTVNFGFWNFGILDFAFEYGKFYQSFPM